MSNDFDHEAHAAKCLRLDRRHAYKKLKLSMDPIKPKIFKNQRKAAKRVYRKLYVEYVRTTVLYVMIIAYCQAGKTGIMLYLIYLFCCKHRKVHVDNVYILTGLSDLEWKTDNKQYFPECLRENILHRNEISTKFFDKFKKSIKNGGQILILIDELHVASGENQSISNIFKKLNLTDPEYCRDHNIIQIEVSATPEGMLKDREDNGNRFEKIVVPPGEGYVGLQTLLDEKRLIQVPDLSQEDEVNVLFDKIIGEFGEQPKYHVIRLPKGKDNKAAECVKNFITRKCDESGTFATPKEFSTVGDIECFNSVVETEPEKHTMIFIKDMLMCSKNIKNKNYIGFWVSRYCKTEPSDSSIIQDVGRMNGYNVPDHVRVFCNLGAVVRYLKWYKEQSENTHTTVAMRGGHREGTTRGRDDLTIERIDRTRVETDVKLRFRVFENVDKAVGFINENFKNVWQVRNEEKNDKTAAQMSIEQILRDKYQISSSRDRWKRIQKAKCGNYVVYWDENHEDAPTSVTESARS